MTRLLLQIFNPETVHLALDRAQIELHDIVAQIRSLEDLGELTLIVLRILTCHGMFQWTLSRRRKHKVSRITESFNDFMRRPNLSIRRQNET